jgi:AcrR family transcriptional regulator
MVEADPRRRSSPKGVQTRAAILRAAAPVFAEHGYRGASLAMVADAVRLTQPGLLHHFPSKEHLLLALLEERDRADSEALVSHFSEEGLELLDALLELVERNATLRQLVQLFAVISVESIAQSHPAHDYVVRRYREVRARLVRDLQVGQAAGEIRADVDMRLLVPVIVAVMDGLQNQWLLDDEVDMVASFRLFHDLLAGVLTQPEPSS